MARAAALGHLGLLLGLLAVILELNGLVIALSPQAGSGASAFYLAIIVWALALVFVVGEWFQAKRTS
ncbi:MAG: hypothetical protein A3K68_01100 [Euryarchaeota archaeon RBG_16_68_13]|nr:MAG: hypothetical protein A3K68_01100 [Euryarchaeota archaeon RBG_16_68_13]